MVVRVFSAALLLASACASPPVLPPTAPSALLEKPAPSFEREALDGSKVDTVALAGKTVVVKFFAEYCEPCKRTLPAAQRLHQKHRDVAFIGISEDDRAQTASDIKNSYGLSFPIIHDRGQVLWGRFRVAEMPMTFVLDDQGVVKWVGGPGQTEKELEQALLALER